MALVGVREGGRVRGRRCTGIKSRTMLIAKGNREWAFELARKATPKMKAMIVTIEKKKKREE